MKPSLASAPTVITCHSNADWDALSSMIGMSMIYPDSIMIFPGSMEKPLNQFFNETAVFLYTFKNIKEIDHASVKRVVVVDTQIRSRVPQVQDLLDLPGVEVEVWDHHPTPYSGEKNKVINADVTHIGTTGSTCTLICQALQERGITPACQEATFLGLGIYGDTGAFTYTSTKPEDFLAGAWLRQHGMDLPFIADLVQTGMTSVHIKVLNELLDSATAHEIGPYSVVLAEATLDSFMGDFAYLAQKFMEMESCNVLFALANMEEKVQVVARSRVDAVDVGQICKALGGGGHRFAASASVKSIPIPELKDAIFQQLYMQVNPNKQARDLMSSPAVGIEDRQTIREAEQLMNRYGLKAAPVFRAGTRHCIGYMECQTASKAIAHELGDMPVSEYMQRTILTVPPDAPLQRLMKIIVGAHQRLVPVVEKNEVIGVVTRTDLINMFVEDPSGVPIPVNTSARERNLAKLLSTRLPQPMLHMLHRAGELGDRLQVSVYAVGGFVRDIMLSRPAVEFDDVDLVVEGDGIAFAKALAQELGGRVREHRTFMTALIIYHDETGEEQRLDVATARLEYYKYPAALPTVELSSIKMDLFRRDFTINAMALRLNELGVLAAIHPSLVLNADKNELLDSLREVIDWYRLLYFKETPELSTLYLMALCSAVPAIETADILHRLGLTPTMREEILSLRESVRMTLVELINWHRDTQKKGQTEQSVSRLCALLAPLPLESTLYLMARSDNEEISSSVSQYIYKWRQIKVDINGDDLHRLGLEPGPQFGSVMRMVLAAKLDGKAETREAQLKLAEELIRKGFPGNGTAGAAPKKPR